MQHQKLNTVVPKRAVEPIGATKQTQKRNRKSCVVLTLKPSSAKEISLNRFAFVVCHSGRIEFVIPEINLRGSEPTENIDDVLSLLVARYNVSEFEIV